MTLQDVLLKTVAFLGVDPYMLYDPIEKEFMGNAGKDAIERISSEFTDIKHVQKLTPYDGFISYSEFEKKVKRVIKVVFRGERIPFTEISSGIQVNVDGECTVTYAYLVEIDDYESEIDIPPIFGITVLGLATASEYCYRRGFYKEGEIFDTRLASALENANRTAKSVVIAKVEL